jgi:hypothetical protein
VICTYNELISPILPNERRELMKKFAVLMMAGMFALSVVSVSLAGSVECTVDKVDGDSVTLTCKGAKLKAGDTVKVKAAKKKAIEGC